MKDLILKHAIINALRHNGKADVQAVIGKILSEAPELKKRIGELSKEIKDVVNYVNSLSIKEQEEFIKKFEIKIEKRKEERGLPPLPNVSGKVVMRLAPFPSGPLHIGNARMVILNDEYVKMYDGKLLLVFDDTIGSEEKFVLSEAYEMILEDLKWLGVKFDEIIYKSDRIEIFYEEARKLIKEKLAYVCECDTKILRENRIKGIECIHRSQSVDENLKKFNDMLAGKYKEGGAVVRLKTDMKHPNPAFRDRVLLRIVDRKHPRVGEKYKVWPLLEFSWAVDDIKLGITHILRGKDLIIEDMMEEFIWDKLCIKKPVFIHYGMLKLKEAKLSKSKARAAIEKKELSGWHDPRTWTLLSLKKRGIQPEAIRKFILNMGLSLTDVTLPAEILYAENRKIIDPIANRFFGVIAPLEISIKKMPNIKEAFAPLHPDFPERGKRKIPVNKKIYIEREDFEKFKNKEVRLMDLFNIKLKKYPEFSCFELKEDVPKIHWVSEPNMQVKMIMPTGEEKNVLAEPNIKDLKNDEIIQLVRVGFARVEIDNEMVLYYAHK